MVFFVFGAVSTVCYFFVFHFIHSYNYFINSQIKAHGIEVLRHEERNMTEDEVREFYSHLQDSVSFTNYSVNSILLKILFFPVISIILKILYFPLIQQISNFTFLPKI